MKKAQVDADLNTVLDSTKTDITARGSMYRHDKHDTISTTDKDTATEFDNDSTTKATHVDRNDAPTFTSKLL
jgi:hypothetical protein